MIPKFMQRKWNIQDFNQTLDLWATSLAQYEEDAFVLQPDKENWSIGQLYMHLIEETNWYLDQVETCLAFEENVYMEITDEAKRMFQTNEFPDEKIKGMSTVANVPNPKNKVQIDEEFLKLGKRARALNEELSKKLPNGKAQHPGLGYFNGYEWLRYSEMHLRHHLRQKARIDSFLKADSKS